VLGNIKIKNEIHQHNKVYIYCHEDIKLDYMFRLL